MIVLDTKVLSELMREHSEPNVVDWLNGIDDETVATTAITVAEIDYGIARLPDGRRRSALAKAADAMITEDFRDLVLPFNLAAAHAYGELVVVCDRAGHPTSMAEAQIAAIGLVEDARPARREAVSCQARERSSSGGYFK